MARDEIYVAIPQENLQHNEDEWGPLNAYIWDPKQGMPVKGYTIHKALVGAAVQVEMTIKETD